MLDRKQLEDYLSKKIGAPVSFEEPNPILLGDQGIVSLAPFGVTGFAYVYRTQSGEHKAVGLPFGLVTTDYSKWAA